MSLTCQGRFWVAAWVVKSTADPIGADKRTCVCACVRACVEASLSEVERELPFDGWFSVYKPLSGKPFSGHGGKYSRTVEMIAGKLKCENEESVGGSVFWQNQYFCGHICAFLVTLRCSRIAEFSRLKSRTSQCFLVAPSTEEQISGLWAVMKAGSDCCNAALKNRGGR